ncbi:MAG: STAS domain-containing protein [Nitrospirales bacterium]|nr:STAS domain-containing protein [Nitrospirales bacterium]
MVVSERSISHEILVDTFAGRFDQHARQDFKWRIDYAITQGYRYVVLNMVAVSFIDSAALGWLVLAQRRFQRIGGKMCIIAPAGFVRDILELTEIGEWIPIFASEDDAVRSLEMSSPSSIPSES